MFNWITGLFGSKIQEPNAMYLVEADHEWIVEQMERIQQEEEHKHFLFIAGLARELFPGDNKAVERVEEAVKKVLGDIV